jgi:glycerol-3-phosphate dehydrogenase
LRLRRDAPLNDLQVDLLVVGGGINGAGIARDAAGRGLSVLLVEKDDLAAHTSSASSKLVHGGLRYLEQLNFGLVRQSLAERERLLRAAPHIVQPLQFIIPTMGGGRPAWMLRAGLFLYDHLARRRMLPTSGAIGLRNPALRPGLGRALSYWDCRVEDSRLVVLNAIDARERGATILTGTELVDAHRVDGHWLARLRGTEGEWSIMARALVNAAGPWAGEMFSRMADVKPRHMLRLVKGSHIVLPRLYFGDHAFVLQNPDGRIVFAIPFEQRFTLIGTTEVEWTGPPGAPTVSSDEVQYLLDTLRRYFRTPVSAEDVVWSYSGIRALCDDGAPNLSQITREYALELDTSGAPLLSVFGGKITTYRRLSEQALNELAPFFPSAGQAWTETAVLPGGDIPDLDLDRYAADLTQRHAALPAELLQRLARTYGTRAERLLDGIDTAADLGQDFGAGLYAREVDHLVSEEWARSAEDVLFRRTKLGLHLPSDAADRLTRYMSGGR